MSDVLKAKNMKRSLLLAIVLFCAEILFAQKGKDYKKNDIVLLETVGLKHK